MKLKKSLYGKRKFKKIFCILSGIKEKNNERNWIFKRNDISKKGKREIIGKGEINGRKWFILDLGLHPTAYVELKQEELDKSKNYDDYQLDVHGGFTFLGNIYCDEEKTYIGWDYAHCYDFSGAYLDSLYAGYSVRENKKWTTKEIFEEVKSVIRQFNMAKWIDGELVIEE